VPREFYSVQQACSYIGSHQTGRYAVGSEFTFLFLFIDEYIFLDKADDIIDSFVQESNHTIGLVKIGWKEPEDPNGLIIKYQIEYRRQDIPNLSEWNISYWKTEK